MKTLFFCLFEEDKTITEKIAQQLNAELGQVEVHIFPDAETLIRIHSEVKQARVILVCSLINPNPKLVPLIFFAQTAKSLGANELILVAPYLAYMRQDKQFRSDEGVSSRYFAELLSQNFDGLLTVDPHLHRYKSLSELYTIPARAISAAPALANWIAKNFKTVFIIGPDKESEQWVSVIANEVKAPYVILEKTRYGDRSVRINLPKIQASDEQTPILLDDIISSGKTMIETIKACRLFFKKEPVCLGVHAVFAGLAYQSLQAMSVKIITSNTISHLSNQVDVSQLLSKELKNFSL